MYCRVGSVDQRTSDEPHQRQRQFAEQTARELGAEILREYYDLGVSSMCGQRFGLERMLRELRCLHVHYCIISQESVLSRDEARIAKFTAQLRVRGVDLVIAPAIAAGEASHATKV